MMLLVGSNLLAIIAVVIVALINSTNVDIQPTWADWWMQGPLQHWGFEEENYHIRVWLKQNQEDTLSSEQFASSIYCVEVVNDGINSVGHSSRPWTLVISGADPRKIKWASESSRCATSGDLVFNGGDVNGKVQVELGLLYPGEKGVFGLVSSSKDAISKSLITVEPISPVNLSVRVTTHSPELGPISKAGNIIFLVCVGVLVIPWSIGTLIVLSEMSDIGAWMFFYGPLIVLISVGQVGIIASMFTKITLVFI